MNGNELKKQRKSLGLSQKELAERMGYADYTAISRKERGVREISKQDELILQQIKTENTMNAAKKDLKDLIDECFEESKKHGYDGEFCDFEFTEHDLDWIVDQFGRKPTFDEWWEAGFSESAIKAWLSAYTQEK